jgi:hypothetical protein
MTEDAGTIPGAPTMPGIAGMRQRFTRFVRAERLPDGTVRSLVYDVTGGLLLPVLCFVFDPFLLQDRSGIGASLQGARTAGYVFLAMQLAALAWRLATRSRSAMIAGSLTAAFAFALLASVFFVPLGLLLLSGFVFVWGALGVLGFVPVWTAHVFARNAERTWMAEPRTWPRVRAAAIGFALALAIPYAAQVAGDAVVRHAIAQVTPAGGGTSALRALRPLAFVLDLRPVLDASRAEDRPARSQALASVLAHLTHPDVLEYAEYVDD